MQKVVLFLKKNQKGLLLLSRLFIGFVFAYAGYTKLTEPIENFRGVIAEYEVFPQALIGMMALIIPWIEFIFGIFMIVGYAPRLSAFVLGMMSLSFIVLLAATGVFSEEGSKAVAVLGKMALLS